MVLGGFVDILVIEPGTGLSVGGLDVRVGFGVRGSRSTFSGVCPMVILFRSSCRF